MRGHRLRGVLALIVMSYACLGSARVHEVRARDGHTLVALGDSVPHGTACDCEPFPELTAEHIAAGAFDDAVAGYRSNDVLDQLDSDTNVIAHVRAADVVLVEVGANDIGYTSACGAQPSCYIPTLPQLRTTLTTIVQRIESLTAGRHVHILLLGYWNVWLGGKYAQARGSLYVAAADALTTSFNATVHAVANGTRSSYVDVSAAFRGADDDDTPLLANDGDHANAAGHQVMAEAVERALRL